MRLQCYVYVNYYDPQPFYDVLLLVLFVGININDDGENTWMRLLVLSTT